MIARRFTDGDAQGPALVLAQSLSFWGGIDPETGAIIDRSHPDVGTSVTGTILFMPGGRGSSSSSSVLAECLRRGTAPAAIVLSSPDPILVVGALVAETLYGIRCPIVVGASAGFTTGTATRVRAWRDGAEVLSVPPR